MKNWYVEIIEYDTEEVVKSLGPMEKYRTEKVDAGMNINLNHEKYYTAIRQESDSGQ